MLIGTALPACNRLCESRWAVLQTVIIIIMVEHFYSVIRVPYTSQNITNQPELNVKRNKRMTSTAPILNEIEKALRTMKNAKAPGLERRNVRG